MGPTSLKPLSEPLLNAIELGNRFVLLLTPYGTLDPAKCAYRTPGKFASYHLHFLGPVSRALYRLYGETKEEEYRASANRCATFLMNTLHDPVTPYASRAEIGGQLRGMLSSAWHYGKALSPCYEWFCRNNPNEDAYELKALAIYRWLQRHRREDSYFGVGYRDH